MNCTDEFIKKGSIKTNILKGILFLQNSLVTDSVYWNWMCLAALISAREVAGTQSMVNRWAPRAHLFLRFCPNLCYPSLPQLHHGRDNETLNHIIWCFQNSMIEALSSKLWYLTSCMPININHFWGRVL